MKNIFIAFMIMSGIAYAANEVTVTTFLKVKNGPYDVQRSINYQDSQLTNSADQGIMLVTPVAKAIPISNVIQPKWSYMRHIGTNGTITLTCTVVLGTNDICILPLGTTNIQAQASSGSTNKLEYWINEK